MPSAHNEEKIRPEPATLRAVIAPIFAIKRTRDTVRR
jgi:hypothetical protein